MRSEKEWKIDLDQAVKIGVSWMEKAQEQESEIARLRGVIADAAKVTEAYAHNADYPATAELHTRLAAEQAAADHFHTTANMVPVVSDAADNLSTRGVPSDAPGLPQGAVADAFSTVPYSERSAEMEAVIRPSTRDASISETASVSVAVHGCTPATECACPARKALEHAREIIESLSGCHPDIIYVYGAYGENWSTNPISDEYETIDFPTGLTVIDDALATPCECAGLREEIQRVYESNAENGRLYREADDECIKLRAELVAAKENYSGAMSDCAQYERQLAAANERAERARKESTDKAECIRELVKGIDGAEYWAPMDAVAYIAKGFLRLRDERDTAQAGWKEARKDLADLIGVVAPVLEPLAAQIARMPYEELTEELQQAIVDDAIPVLRAVVARFDAQGGTK